MYTFICASGKTGKNFIHIIPLTLINKSYVRHIKDYKIS